jgi:hypothetical protein
VFCGSSAINFVIVTHCYIDLVLRERGEVAKIEQCVVQSSSWTTNYELLFEENLTMGNIF